ncbi:MAG: hypothetical protein AMXMBFR7_12730 [Planctomycetota bacterium]|nr:30S ribosomal protein S16 [Planctomycetota bacterium]
MVKIRLLRTGRRNAAQYRIVLTDARVKRQGRYLEKLGNYDPTATSDDKKVLIDKDRVQHWLSHGAQPTESVVHLLKKVGLNVLEATRQAHEKRRAKAKKKSA